MIAQETEIPLELIRRERDEWERKKRILQIAAQVARLEEDDESVKWFEREYLAAHARYQEACRSLITRAR
jgi:hypothetical protein